MIGFRKLEKFFTIWNNKFYEFYNPSEHLAADEVTVLFKGRMTVCQYIPKKHKRFGIKIYKRCNSLGYTHDMTVYSGKQRQLATEEITSTHGIVLQLICRVEGLGNKIYMDNYEGKSIIIRNAVVFVFLLAAQLFCSAPPCVVS
jgi:hypothetical protein